MLRKSFFNCTPNFVFGSDIFDVSGMQGFAKGYSTSTYSQNELEYVNGDTFMMYNIMEELRSHIVYRGGFNPPHKGHMSVVEDCVKCFMADNVIVTPVYKHEVKKEFEQTYEFRLSMLMEATKGLDKVTICREKDTASKSLIRQRFNYPHDSITLILGMDLLQDIVNGKWVGGIDNLKRILKYANVMFIVRRGFEPPEHTKLQKIFDGLMVKNIRELKMHKSGHILVQSDPAENRIKLSSTEIRNLIAQEMARISNGDWEDKVPSGVAKIIRNSGRYTNATRALVTCPQTMFVADRNTDAQLKKMHDLIFEKKKQLHQLHFKQ